MLTNVKMNVTDPQIAQLLEYAVLSDLELQKEATERYINDSQSELYAFQLENKPDYIGLIGFCMLESTLVIQDLTVVPEYRLMGCAREIVLQILLQQQPERIVVNTDEVGADFFRNIGFVVTSAGETPQGLENFHCVYEVNEEEEE